MLKAEEETGWFSRYQHIKKKSRKWLPEQVLKRWGKSFQPFQMKTESKWMQFNSKRGHHPHLLSYMIKINSGV
ncbi:hypothetical protein AV530_000680 [Patagioenas fasciata monilis]|uniref:Uncharacterized protein n=1 Tax=Patagioenas fasciata monilis TaxID=372326 RepID=A0A1V4IH06_PATFA|nr:hypothetical protein AV530_000680 [Patagioenas fasciata monilis]